MAKISTKDIKQLAMLGNISLTDSEQEGLRENIESVLAYVEQLDELNVDGVEPSYQVTGLATVWRDDEVKNDISPSHLLALSSSVQDNQIKVPKVL